MRYLIVNQLSLCEFYIKFGYNLNFTNPQTKKYMKILGVIVIMLFCSSILYGQGNTEKWKVFELTLPGPATGNPFKAIATHVWTIKNGKLTHLFQAADTVTITR